MGTSFRCNRAIFSASTSTQTTSLPVSAKHAPATRPTYPLPTTATCMSRLVRDCVAGVHHQLGIALDHPVIHRAVVRHDHDAVSGGNLLGGQLNRAEFTPIFPECRHVWIEVAHLGSLTFEQADDVQSRALPDVLDVALIGDTQHQHRSPLHRLALAIER